MASGIVRAALAVCGGRSVTKRISIVHKAVRRAREQEYQWGAPAK